MRRTSAVVTAVFATTLAALSAAGGAGAAEWRVDPTASRLSFTGTQAGKPFEGAFRRFSATIRFDAKALSDSRAIVVIDMGSVETGNPQGDEAVKGSDWFAAARFPEARFETRAFRPLGGERWQADATLTIRDVTKPVVLPFTLAPEDGGTRAKGELSIERTDYGVGQGQWASGAMVGIPVIIRFDLLASPMP